MREQDCGTCCVCENSNDPSSAYDELQDNDCGYIDCDVLDQPCQDYDDVRVCTGINSCAVDNSYCTVFSYNTSATICNDNYLCSDSLGGDGLYDSTDYSSPSQGYCDNLGTCDFAMTTGTACDYPEDENIEAGTVCVDGNSECVDTCSDLISNDGDLCIDGDDSDCGGTEILCNDGLDNDCDGDLNCDDSDCVDDVVCLECVHNSDCDYGDLVCTENECENCTLSAQCDPGDTCLNGNCIDCDLDDDLAEGPQCGGNDCDDSDSNLQTCVCSEFGGDICIAGEMCPGSVESATDSERCCSETCVEPVWNNCGECGTGALNLCDRTECNSISEGCFFIDDGIFANDDIGSCTVCPNSGTCTDYETDELSCTEDHCGTGECYFDESCMDCWDIDGDSFSEIICGGTDCNDDAASIYPDANEICDDEIDNHCIGDAGYGFIDCLDPDCINEDVCIKDLDDDGEPDDTDCDDNNINIGSCSGCAICSTEILGNESNGICIGNDDACGIVECLDVNICDLDRCSLTHPIWTYPQNQTQSCDVSNGMGMCLPDACDEFICIEGICVDDDDLDRVPNSLDQCTPSVGKVNPNDGCPLPLINEFSENKTTNFTMATDMGSIVI